MRQTVLSLLLLATLPAFAVDKMANVVCFVKFADQADNEWNHDFDYYETMFNDASEGANSVRNYFHDMSYGKMEWTSTIVRTVYVDTRNRTQLCKKSDAAPDGYTNSVIASQFLEPAFVADVCKGIEAALPDDIELDYDGDGEVDNLTLIINGNSELGSSHLLWPSNNRATFSTAKLKGKKGGNYLKVFDGANGYTSLRPNQINTGVLCHEMTHSLDAFDLYASGSKNPVGVWDLMSDNQTIPQGFTVYMRKNYGGWIPEVKQLREPGVYTVAPIDSKTAENVAYKITTSYASPEYFMVEYRSKESLWDKSLPNDGLLVYRVNETAENGNLSTPYEVYVFRPGGSTTANGTIANAPLGGSTGRVSFGASGDADYPFYSDGKRADFSITDVKKVDGGMQFALSFDVASIEDSFADGESLVYDAASGELTATGAVSVEIYSVSGMRVVSLRDAAPGLYVARAVFPSGNVKTLKFRKD